MNKVIAREYVEKNYIHKDKIIELINYYKKIDNPVGIRVLEKLLEE